MGFLRQEYRSGLPFPPPGNLPDPGIEPVSPALVGRFFITEPPGKPICRYHITRCFALLSFVKIYHSFFTDLSTEGLFPVGEWIVNEVL